MTQYRLAALEYRQVVTDRYCPTCGQEKSDVVVETRRYRQGDVIDVTGAEEERLLDAGALVPIADDQVVEEPVGEVAEDADTEVVAEPVVEPVATGDGESKRPRKAGPVDEWRAYAISKGIDPEEAAELTKVELIELVGEG